MAMQKLLNRASTLFLLVLTGVLLCTSLVACSSAHNPNYCSVAPPTGYPTFTAVGGILYIQSDRSDSLYALRSSNGALLWKYQAGVLLAVAHGMVYVEDTNDVFYALQASDGSVRWKFDMGKDTSSAIAVVDNLVYFTSSTTLTLYTLSASDGTRVWQQKIDTDHYPSTIMAARGIVYVAAEYGRITAYRESDGFKLWQDEVGNEPPGNPLTMTLGNGIIYATSSQTTALRASDGAVLWRFSGTGTLIVGNNVVYLSADNQYQLYALRASDGAQLWHWHYPSSGNYTLTLANDVLYAGPGGSIRGYEMNRARIATYSNHLYALKSSTGTLLWSQPLQGLHVALSAANGTVYTLSTTGLDAWQASNGKLAWHTALQQVGLMIVDGTLYAGTAGYAGDCFSTMPTKLSALRPGDGSQLWQFQARAPTRIDHAAASTRAAMYWPWM